MMETVRLRYQVSELKTGPFGSALSADEYVEDAGIPLINPSDLDRGIVRCADAAKVSEAVAERLATYRAVAGDLLLARRGELGRFGIVSADQAGVLCGTGSLLVRPSPEKLNERFLGYVLQTNRAREWLSLQSVGSTMENISEAIVARLPIPKTSVTNQERIANFLDAQTARIDALIAEKERLFAILGEALESELLAALTHGLDGDAITRSSREPFIGPIPQHWKTIAWKRLGSFTGGTGFPIEAQGCTTEELPFFKVKDLNAEDLLEPLCETDNTISRSTAVRLRATVFDSGTLTFAKVGAALFLLRVRRLGVPACLDNNMMAFTPNANAVDPLFAQLALGLLPLAWLVNPGAVPSISASQVGDVKVALPPLPEQRSITKQLIARHQKFRDVRLQVTEHISRLREYRSSLISAAVTGQIDINSYNGAA